MHTYDYILIMACHFGEMKQLIGEQNNDSHIFVFQWRVNDMTEIGRYSR